MRFLSFAVACVAVAGARPARAQVSAVGLRDLAFGPVVQGVALQVLPSDPVKAGQLRVVAATGSMIRLQFDLPTKLVGPPNDVLKIRFGTTDGIAAQAGGTDEPVTFDPTRPQTFTMTNTTLNILLGGTVTANSNQSGGSYSNTITLTVTVL
ncbi:MAG TPA: hypothetical protein VHR43_00720 [Gemmatimonadales bacterium]|jgi:hypothetical protein|nr:hypothetical protein [Gemmatimonadales bacterium]